MSDAIKRSLRAELDRQIARPERNLGAVVKRGTRKRAMKWMATGMTTAIVIAGAGLLWRDLVGAPVRFGPSQGEHQNEDPSPRLLGNGCPRSRGKASGSRWTSPTVRVATGTSDGNDWVLCARTVERTQGEDRGAEALCMDWLYGDGGSSGLTCIFSHDAGHLVPLDESYFDATSGPEWGYFFGAVPAAARSVTLDATRLDAQVVGNVHAAPEKLGVPFQFFTLFAEPYADGTLVVRDADGDVIRERVMDHGLSQLVVAKDGSGQGMVTGYRTAELFIYEDCKATGDTSCREPRPVWIECGDDCDAALDDARITLVAEPAEGSRFVGWSGACSGTGECELVVDENLTVTAVFEASP